MNAAIETERLGRRYARRWALRECSLSLPAGRVIGLIGPNGAGKSTLLHLAAGLLAPTSGTLRVLGRSPQDPEVLAHVALVAQDKPLYGRFTVAETLRMGGWLNPGWDQALAEAHLSGLGIPLEQRVGRLSGGQHAQVALALALGKRPDLMLLDEPAANLDPLGRREFMQALLAHVAEAGTTVLLSSHLVDDLERACDYLVMLSASRVQIAAPVDEVLAGHLAVTGPRAKADAIEAAHTVVRAHHTGRQSSLLIRARGPVLDPDFTSRPAGLEEIVLAYMSSPLAGLTPALALAAPTPEGSR